jgi:hypothetical protein
MALINQGVRRGKRVPFTMGAPLSTGSGRGGLIKDSSTVDLSGYGVRLRLRGQIVPGQIVDVFLSKRSERCRVVWTSPTAISKELIAGLEFICPLPDPRSRQTPSSSSFEPGN